MTTPGGRSTKILEVLSTTVLAENNCHRVGIDPSCSYGQVFALGNLTSAALSSAGPVLQSLRSQKSPNEIALMQAAKTLTLDVHIAIFEWIKPGMRMSEVIAEIDRLHRAGGADNGSFFCAVQFGEGTSHPHGVPGDPTLAEHELSFSSILGAPSTAITQISPEPMR